MKLLIFFLLLSSACFGQVKPNYRDSANKYWKISMVWKDSADRHKELKNMLLYKYFHRKEEEAMVTSVKFVEKQY